MSTATGGAFGAGKAGAPFDPLQYIKRPQVILRAVSSLFAIIVFGCISSKAWYAHACIMNRDDNACGYGTGIGVLAFLICIGFLIVDAFFENLSSVQHRKYAVLADLGISGLWTFLWFVGFCYLTDAWRKTDKGSMEATHGKDNVQAAIAFSFFSIFTWGAITFFAVRRYRMGAQEAFASGYDQDPNASSPYSSFPGSDTGDPYQQPPFSQQKEVPDYQQPTY
ncbi:synaptogyrin-2-like [Biomphalaria glabrata]|uniref:Synaptogyrin n=1 Tax=Biomphalaria glabrata TaxID=6526 RepID=A0A9W2ZR05_BIOGL|nr:synaptogyrin-2-like [Biomphalaria glabrata]KAI8764914.1 synaptogyrin-2 [Biomphalaria glabrata]